MIFDRFVTLAGEAPAVAAVLEGESGPVHDRAAVVRRAVELVIELSRAGLRAGDGLAIQLPNSLEFVAAFLAACRLDLVVVPVDRDAPETEVASILTHFAIKGLLYRGGLSARVIAEQPAVPRGTRLVKLTSGSTGMPKGIVASEANLVADCTNICSSMGIAPDDVNLGAIPLSHSYGFSNLVTPLLWQGTALVVSNDYLPQSLATLAARRHCTVAPLIPMVFEHLTTLARGDGDLRSVRTFISAGAPLPASTSRRFRERFGNDIHSFYGCSECGGITYDRAGGAVERGAVGAPLDGVSVELTGARLTVRSDSVALGTLLDAATFVAFDGTYQTDDLAELREGEVVLTGRASDLINTAGKKVNPREVEAVILQMEGVREAKVYGEEAGARGEVVAAAIVASPDVTREQVRAFCRARLSLHKVPRIVKLIDALPVDDRGKVKRAALAEL